MQLVGRAGRTAVAVALLTLAACGSDASPARLPFVHPDAARLGGGTSTTDCGDLDSGGLDGLINDDTTWVRVTGLSITGPAAAPPLDETAPASATLVEQLPGSITLERGPIYFDVHEPTARRLLSVDPDQEVWLELRVTPAAALGAMAVDAMVIAPSGFAFVGICAQGATVAAATNLWRHVQTMDAAVVILRSFMSHETGGVDQLLG